MYPWPWTVTWGGKGRYFANKQEAVQTVKGLKASGIKNIDVGCMQINLMYHPNAFKSVEEVFNPESNIGYASQFLKGLYSNTAPGSKQLLITTLQIHYLILIIRPNY